MSDSRSKYEDFMKTPAFMQAQIAALADALEETSQEASDFEKMFEQAMAEAIKASDAYEYVRDHFQTTLNEILEIADGGVDRVALDQIREKVNGLLVQGE